MERCRNCGAPARVGAKFCTTCGYRLPEPTAATDDAPASFDRASDSPAEGSGADPSTQDDAPSPESTPVATADSPDAPLAAPDDADASDTGVAGDGPTGDAAASADRVLSSSWPTPTATSWPSGWDTPQELREPDSTTPGPEAGPGASWPSHSTDTADDAQPEADPTAIAPESGGTLPPAIPPGDDDEIGLASSELDVAPTEPREADQVARAIALIDELRALLPTLATAPPVDLTAVAADLEAALTADAGQGPVDLADLRAAMLAARDRPRDIDTVLDLVGRVDAVLAFLDAHDRLTAAAERAVAALRAAE